MPPTMTEVPTRTCPHCGFEERSERERCSRCGKSVLIRAPRLRGRRRRQVLWGSVAAGVLVFAAVYELTPLKDVCLAKCRSPLGFLLGSWRDGPRGALEMGARHAAWCVGCCWALMAALFALGVMSVGWMAFVAALIAIEKLAPWKSAANRAIAVTLVVLGLAVVIVPEQVPGLTVPTSASNGMTMQDGS